MNHILSELYTFGVAHGMPVIARWRTPPACGGHYVTLWQYKDSGRSPKHVMCKWDNDCGWLTGSTAFVTLPDWSMMGYYSEPIDMGQTTSDGRLIVNEVISVSKGDITDVTDPLYLTRYFIARAIDGSETRHATLQEGVNYLMNGKA